MTTIAVVILSVLSCVVCASGQACPQIVARSDWQARPTTSTAALRQTPAPFVVVHHTASPPCSTRAECSQSVRNMQAYHMDTRRYADIGYSFLIGGDGLVYEGRGWDREGAHAPGYNARSIGICMIGNFSGKLPNAAALAALERLIACGSGSQGKIASSYKLLGHRQTKATECPGAKLYEHLKTMPHWSSV